MTSLSRAPRALLTAVLAAILFAAWAGPANADTLSIENDSLLFTDDAGETGPLTVNATPASITFTNSTAGDTIDGDDDCDGDTTATVTCTPADISLDPAFFDFWYADMGDGNDNATATGSLGGSTFGGGGNDTLLGSDTNQNAEYLDGDDGVDTINSRNVGPPFPEGTFGSPDSDGFPGIFPVSDRVTGGDDGDVIVTGNGNDEVSGDFSNLFLFSASRSSAADGAATGADQISTGSGDDFAAGDCGDGDVINLGDGNDFTETFVRDGAGDTIDGGAGLDSIRFFSTSDFGPDEECNLEVAEGLPFDDFNINLATGAAQNTNNLIQADTAVNLEDVFTDPGNDTVVGTDASNSIGTDLGNDSINPGNGADVVFSDSSRFGIAIATTRADGADGTTPTPTTNDSIDLADGWNDRLDCGPGTDTVQADQFDVDPNQDGNLTDSGVSATCEAVTVVERRAGGADVVGPDCTLGRVKRSYGRTAFLRGFNVRITCNEGGTVTVQLLASFSKKLFPSKAGDVVLAQKSTTVTAGTAKGVKVKPLRKFRSRLRKTGFKTRLIVETQDQYGNRGIERKTVRVKKTKPKRKRRRR